MLEPEEKKNRVLLDRVSRNDYPNDALEKQGHQTSIKYGLG